MASDSTFTGKIQEGKRGFLTRNFWGKIFFVDKFSPLIKEMHVGEEWEFQVKFEKDKWGVVVPLKKIEKDEKVIDVDAKKCRWYKVSGDYKRLYKEEDWKMEMEWRRGILSITVHCPSMKRTREFIFLSPEDEDLEKFFDPEVLQKEIIPKFEEEKKKYDEDFRKRVYGYWYKFWKTIKHKIENGYDIVGLKIDKDILPPTLSEWKINREKNQECRLPALIIKDKIYYLSGYNLSPIEKAPSPVLRVHKLTDYIKNNKIEKIAGYPDMVLLKPIDEIEYERRDENETTLFDSEIKYIIKKFIYDKGIDWKGKIKISIGIGDIYASLGDWDRNLLIIRVEGYCLHSKYYKEPGKREIYYKVERGGDTYVGSTDDWGGATGWGYHAGPSIEVYYFLRFIEIDPYKIFKAPEKPRIKWFKTITVNITDDLAQKLQERMKRREYIQKSAKDLMKRLRTELEDFIYL